MLRMAHRMLLNDRIVQERLGESREDIEGAVCVDVQSLYAVFREQDSRLKHPRDLHVLMRSCVGNLRMPHKNVIFEFKDDGGREHGVWCCECVGQVSVSVCTAIQGQASRLFGCWIVGVDEQGQHDGTDFVMPLFDDGVIRRFSQHQAALMTSVSTLHVFGLFCLSMLNCRRQTELIERPEFNPPDKWLRRQKQPKLRYHVLSIDPLKKMLRYDEKADPTGKELAWHLCRGHWKHYTAEKPRLGKYVGSVWCPPHARGKKENGVVLKEYKVETAGVS
jgi:hypothetical protein